MNETRYLNYKAYQEAKSAKTESIASKQKPTETNKSDDL